MAKESTERRDEVNMLPAMSSLKRRVASSEASLCAWPLASLGAVLVGRAQLLGADDYAKARPDAGSQGEHRVAPLV